MTHREKRLIIHDICNNFYMRIKDLDNSTEAWERIAQMKEEYCLKYKNARFCQELILAIANEHERSCASVSVDESKEEQIMITRGGKKHD